MANRVPPAGEVVSSAIVLLFAGLLVWTAARSNAFRETVLAALWMLALVVNRALMWAGWLSAHDVILINGAAAACLASVVVVGAVASRIATRTR